MNQRYVNSHTFNTYCIFVLYSIGVVFFDLLSIFTIKRASFTCMECQSILLFLNLSVYVYSIELLRILLEY